MLFLIFKLKDLLLKLNWWYIFKINYNLFRKCQFIYLYCCCYYTICFYYLGNYFSELSRTFSWGVLVSEIGLLCYLILNPHQIPEINPLFYSILKRWLEFRQIFHPFLYWECNIYTKFLDMFITFTHSFFPYYFIFIVDTIKNVTIFLPRFPHLHPNPLPLLSLSHNLDLNGFYPQ